MNSRQVRCQPGLPICRYWDRLAQLIRKNQVVIVTGETGSGKSTQLPKICLAAGRGRKKRIACTQPRRIAAISLARRVGQELQPLGSGVSGYKIRFQDQTGRATRIKFVTDGMLLAEIQADRNLREYDTVILDEAHERSLNIDLLAGLLRRLLKRRRDLKLVITSATMEVEKFRKFFNNPPLVEVEGRSYPVEILYQEPETGEEQDLKKQVKDAIKKIRAIDPFGHILVFLPTERDILEIKKALSGTLGDQCLILPLFGRLSARDQARIFAPSGRQKIVLSTNIAETSITVPGIRYIVDSGLARISQYNINTHTTALPVSRISRASADQRAGRAGRVEAGICIRLFSREDYLSRPEYTLPEILRCNLAELILKLHYYGHGPVEGFPFIDPPSRSAVREGIHTLKELGALDSRERLTGLGKKMARLPLDPRLSRMILQAAREDCLREILVIASALSIQDPRQRPADREREASKAHETFQDERSDFLTWINLWNSWFSLKEKGATGGTLRRFCREHYLSYPRMREWEDIFNQLITALCDLKITKNHTVTKHFKGSTREITPAIAESVHRAVLSGFLGNVAVKKGKNDYAGTKGKEIFIFPGSVLFSSSPRWIVSSEQIRTSRLFARTAAPVKPEWIEEFGSKLCKYSYFEPRWVAARGEAVCTEKVTLYGLTVIPGRLKPLKKVDPDLARKLLISEGLAGCALKNRFSFNERNRRLLDEIRALEEKTRSLGPLVDHELLTEFFDSALKSVEKKAGFRILDEADLKKALKKHGEMEHLLKLDRDFLTKKQGLDSSSRLYPGHLEISGHQLPLTYRFCPGHEDDGITVTVPLVILPQIKRSSLEWLVPGFLEQKVAFILKHLPKQYRKHIFDYERLAWEITSELMEQEGDFQQALIEALRKRLPGVITARELAAIPPLPDHLVMRLEVVDGKRALEASRDIETLREKYFQSSRRGLLESPEWKRACSKWEQVVSFSKLDEIPQHISIGTINGIKIRAYPALVPDHGQKDRIWLRLFPDQEEAIKKSRSGLMALMEAKLKKELKHASRLMERRLKKQARKKALMVDAPFPAFRDIHALTENAVQMILGRHLVNIERIPSSEDFSRLEVTIRKALVADAEHVLGLLQKINAAQEEFTARRMKISQESKFRGYAAGVISQIDELASLLSTPLFPADRSLEFLAEMPRFIRALDLRLQRAFQNPAKDREKQKRFQKYLPLLEKLHENRPGEQVSPYPQEELELHLWEFMVSVFAPELSVRGRISEKKLNTLLNLHQ